MVLRGISMVIVNIYNIPTKIRIEKEVQKINKEDMVLGIFNPDVL